MRNLFNTMRIWHSQLIPKLCRQHLLAMWREGLGAYSIITKGKHGYFNHPAVIEFKNCPNLLWMRLYEVREEMRRRGYKPKALPSTMPMNYTSDYKEWQTLDEQIAILRTKKCECKV